MKAIKKQIEESNPSGYVDNLTKEKLDKIIKDLYYNDESDKFIKETNIVLKNDFIKFNE